MVSKRKRRRRRRALKLYLIKRTFRTQTKRKKYWVHPLLRCRNIDGEHLKLDRMMEFPDRFAKYTRMSPEVFQILLSMVGSSLARIDTNWRKAIPARIRLYVILRYLATGDSLRTIGTSFSIGHATVWKIVRTGLPIIWTALKDNYVKWPSRSKWDQIVDGFYQKWNLPNCLGAIDGKHVVIEAPAKSGSLYYNYKGTFSIVLLATCDADYNFTTIDVGGYGKQSDGGILAGSTLGRQLNSGILFTSNRNLPTTSTCMPCFFVGDEAFPLSTRLMRPYPGKELSESQRVFNYRLSRARRCIENAFGIMSARWRIFRRPIAAEPKQVENIVLACVALHNFVKKEGRGLEDELSSMQGDLHGESQNVRTPCALIEERAFSVPAQDRASKKMRDDLCMYLMNEGAVDWQLSKINA